MTGIQLGGFTHLRSRVYSLLHRGERPEEKVPMWVPEDERNLDRRLARLRDQVADHSERLEALERGGEP